MHERDFANVLADKGIGGEDGFRNCSRLTYRTLNTGRGHSQLTETGNPTQQEKTHVRKVNVGTRGGGRMT